MTLAEDSAVLLDQVRVFSRAVERFRAEMEDVFGAALHAPGRSVNAHFIEAVPLVSKAGD